MLDGCVKKMNKIIPIKLKREHTNRTTRIVEWRLSNVCNFNCSFCPSEFKDGSKRFLEYDQYITAIDRLIDQDLSKTVWFQFTGGEPSLYPKLFDLLKHIKDRGGYTSMISNGSRTIRWWKELAEHDTLDRLYITHHPEQDTDVHHTIAVNDIMQATNTLTTIFVTTQTEPRLFEAAVTAHKTILSSTPAISSLKPISVEGETLQNYTDEQLKTIQDNLYVRSTLWNTISKEKSKYLKTVPWYQSEMIMHYSDGTTKKESSQYFVHQLATRFKDWECDVGKDLLLVEVDEVYRSMCREGGVIYNVLDQDFTWATNSVICSHNECNCSLDVQEPKRRL